MRHSNAPTQPVVGPTQPLNAPLPRRQLLNPFVWGLATLPGLLSLIIALGMVPLVRELHAEERAVRIAPIATATPQLSLPTVATVEPTAAGSLIAIPPTPEPAPPMPLEPAAPAPAVVVVEPVPVPEPEPAMLQPIEPHPLDETYHDPKRGPGQGAAQQAGERPGSDK